MFVCDCVEIDVLDLEDSKCKVALASEFEDAGHKCRGKNDARVTSAITEALHLMKC